MTEKKAKPNYSAKRLKLLRASMRKLKLDALITLNTTNARWLTAWSEIFDEEPAHMVLITATKAHIHTDLRYSDAMRAKNKKDLWSISDERISHGAFAQSIFSHSRKQKILVGYESNIRLDHYKALKKELTKTPAKLVETKNLFEHLRAVKDEEEVRLLKKAQKITDTAFSDLLTWVASDMTELEVANRLEFTMKSLGAGELAFTSIAASGPRSAVPHSRPSTRRLCKGDFLVLDFGARYHDYCADMTRTLVIGEATEKQRTIYNTVLAAQTKAKAEIQAGITGKEAHNLAVEVLKAEGLDAAFKHSLGHGVGIDIHEQPMLSPVNTEPLVAGNVVTTEPGVYLNGYGGVRIEDYGIVGETGFKCFTRSPHELIEITR